MSDTGPAGASLTAERVRHLTADDLGLAGTAAPTPTTAAHAPLDEDDPILLTTRDLLRTFGGVVFVGPPGTSKSWYAARAAIALADGDESLVRFVQFHPSYQYEDFVEGFVPKEEGGFHLAPKHFLVMCDVAVKNPTKTVVLVIDELSRGDPGRVFGEALTYVELSKRNLEFSLTSGRTSSVPPNLVILATMNPLDRGVDEVDAALERRFAKISMEPDPGVLAQLLAESGMADDLRDRLVAFFEAVNGKAKSNPLAAVGHTYFIGTHSVDGLTRVWEHQLKFHFDKAYRLDPEGRADIDRMWNRVLGVLESTPDTNAETSAAPATDGEAN